MITMGLLLELSLYWLLLLNANPASSAAVGLSGVKPDCNATCGNLEVPYPFGIGVECAANAGLNITCNYAYTPPRPFIGPNLEVMSISESEVRIKNLVTYTCYNSTGYIESYSKYTIWVSGAGVYTFSDKRNKFFSVGCQKVAIIKGRKEDSYTSGCVSFCRKEQSQKVVDGSCSGMGCGQIPIPQRLAYFRANVLAVTNLECDWNIGTSCGYAGTCGYAFLGDPDVYKFQSSDLTISRSEFVDRIEKNVPIVLDWVVENSTCKEARRNKTSYACQTNNTDCVNSKNGLGYRCKCKNGYEGNPYLEPGCQDVDECRDISKYKCFSGSKCENRVGSYDCVCPDGMSGDGKNEQGCIPKQQKQKMEEFKVALGFGLGLLLLLVGFFFLHSGLSKRKLAKLRESFFKQNGGLLLLQHQISLHRTGGATRIYTAEELAKATNNYDESHIIGEGGYGTVYRGVLPPDNKIVAVKKSKIVDKTQIEQFINEVVILTQINHKNVVKLLGCCLETQVPLLVYEFISNGTLYDHIHNRSNGRIGTVASKFSWYNCLRIATESSRALSYLHSAASIPIIHRDVKSANILLDDNYSAKVADFGASALIPLDQAQVATILQGTPGYLDPESYQTGRLTEKSDVYSFGVVLAEILTGKTPVSLQKSDKRISLSAYFISAMKENALLQIVDDRLVDEAEREQLYAVAALAMKCLAWTGEERPTMKDVLEELEGLMKLAEQHPWAQEKTEETVSLLDDHSDLYPRAAFSVSMGESSGQYSMNLNNSLMSPLNLPR